MPNFVALKFRLDFGLSNKQYKHLVSIVDAAVQAQVKWSNEGSIDAEEIADEAVDVVNTFAKDVMKVDSIAWNGLYPSFTKGDIFDRSLPS